MKLYILFECTGSFEDYHEHMAKGFFSKEKAEFEKKRRENEAALCHKQYIQCNECSYSWFSSGTEQGLKAFINIAQNKPCFKLAKIEHEYDEYYTSCNNCMSDYEEPIYKIKEIEVEE